MFAQRQEYWNRDDCFIAICKHAVFLNAFSFYIDWFTQNYKGQTDSKLPESGLCAHTILKTCVLQRRHGKGDATEHWGVFLLRQNETLISSPAS